MIHAQIFHIIWLSVCLSGIKGFETDEPIFTVFHRYCIVILYISTEAKQKTVD